MRKSGICECRFRRWLMLGEPPCSPRPPPLVRFADKALRAFPEAGRFAAGALCHHQAQPSSPTVAFPHRECRASA
jgi:hypothetical protein